MLQIRNRHRNIVRELGRHLRELREINAIPGLAIKIDALIDALADSETPLQAIRSAVNELRAVLLQILTQNDDHNIHERVISTCQFLTYLCPNNMSMLVTGDLKSLIDNKPFPDKRLYYGLAGNIYHISEVSPIKASVYRRINDGDVSDYERAAIANFIKRENGRDRHILLQAMNHHMLRGFMFVFVYLEGIVNRYDACIAPAPPIENLEGQPGLIAMPFIAIMGMLRTLLYYTIGLGFLCPVVEYVSSESARETCECLSTTLSDIPSYITDIPRPLIVVLGYSAVMAALIRAYPNMRSWAQEQWNAVSGNSEFNPRDILISTQAPEAALITQMRFALQPDNPRASLH